ncbi:MAG: phosphoserine phosphatase SerB [Lautropia sp.]
MRLVVQHPRLADAAIGCFAAEVGRMPDRRAADLATWDGLSPGSPTIARVRELGAALGVDADLVAADLRLEDFRLIAFDMDSTLITVECIDEIADFAGRRAEVSAITEATMRGEIADFAESLRRRVACLRGVPATALQSVLDDRVRLTPGAGTLIARAKAAGLATLLVSGGFTFFTDALRERLGLDHARANRLEIVDGTLSGRVVGPVVDAAFKHDELLRRCAALGIGPTQAIVVGDGANDLRMMSIAGLSVAWRAKPVVRAQAHVALGSGGLDALLNLFVA